MEERRYLLSKEFTTIGRSRSTDLCLPERSVSRCHATVAKTPEGYAIFDERSHNGVVLNGRPIAQAALREGDLLRIGEFYLRFTQGSLCVTTTQPKHPERRHVTLALTAVALASPLILLGAFALLLRTTPDQQDSKPNVMSSLRTDLNRRSQKQRSHLTAASVEWRQEIERLIQASEPSPIPVEPKHEVIIEPPTPDLPPPPSVKAPDPKPVPAPSAEPAPPKPEPTPQPRVELPVDLGALEKRIREALDRHVAANFSTEELSKLFAQAAEINSTPAVDLLLRLLSTVRKTIDNAQRQRAFLQNQLGAFSRHTSYEIELRKQDLLAKKISIVDGYLRNLSGITVELGWALRNFNAPEALRQLLDRWSELKEDAVREGAVEALESHASAQHAVSLGGKLRSERRPDLREAIVRTLARLKTTNDSGISALIDQANTLKNPVSLRVESIKALGEIGAKSAIPTLIELVGNRNEELRTAGHEALFKITGAQVEPTTAAWRSWFQRSLAK